MLSYKRDIHNSWMFIILYCSIGVVSGILFDSLMTFLQATSPELAKSFASYLGLSTFAGALIMLLVPKLGYKRIMLCGAIVGVMSMIAVINVQKSFLVHISVFLLITSISLFDVVLPPYLSTYTTEQNRSVFFTRALFSNISGAIIGTFLGGPMIVWKLSMKLHISYQYTKEMTERVQEFSSIQYNYYVAAHREVLLFFVFILSLAIVPILFISEAQADYRETIIEKKIKNSRFQWNLHFNKYAAIFLAYMGICKIAASMIIPYVSIYLGILGIDRATTSMIITAQYFAIGSFMLITPYLVKRIGQVKTLGWLCLASIPFMFIIGNIGFLGSNVAWLVGCALFFRTGLINATNPIVTSLPMELVSKSLRPVYASSIFIVQGLSQTVTGLFTKQFLFTSNTGYSQAYIIAGFLFSIASILLLFIFTKDYNFPKNHEERLKEVNV